MQIKVLYQAEVLFICNILLVQVHRTVLYQAEIRPSLAEFWPSFLKKIIMIICYFFLKHKQIWAHPSVLMISRPSSDGPT